MRAVCADFECELVEFDGEDNHVHLLVNFPPKAAVTNLAAPLKGGSSRRLPGVRRPHPALLEGQQTLGRLLLRRDRRRRTAERGQAVHRAAQAAGPICRPPHPDAVGTPR